MNNKDNLKRIEDALKRRETEGDKSIGNIRSVLTFIRKSKKFASKDIFKLAEAELAVIDDKGAAKPVCDAYIADARKKGMSKAKAKAEANGERFNASAYALPASSVSSKRSNVKKLMLMVQELNEVRSGDRTAASAGIVLADESELDYKKLLMMPFWDAFEALVHYFLPDCVRPDTHPRGKYNRVEVESRLGLGVGQSSLRNQWSYRRALKQDTMDKLYAGFCKYDSKIPVELFRSLVAKSVERKGIKKIVYAVNELPESLAKAVHDYVEFRYTLSVPRVRSLDGDATEIRINRPLDWKRSGDTESAFRGALNRFVGYLVNIKEPAINPSDLTPACLIDRANWIDYLDWRDRACGNSAGSTRQDMNMLKDISNPEGWWMHFHGQHLSPSEKQSFQTFFKREATDIALTADRQRKSREDETGLEAGKKNAPWFFGAGTTAERGWKFLLNIIENLKLNVIRAGENEWANGYLLSAVWLMMEAELPLRVDNTKVIVLGTKDDIQPNLAKKLATFYRKDDQWHLFLPKSLLKNSTGRHVEDIVWSYNQINNQWFDMLTSKIKRGERLFGNRIDGTVRGRTRHILSQLHPDQNYPGMNPHVMRHIVATYRINVLNQSATKVASVLMDKPETVLATYFSNDHAGNLKSAQDDCAAMWAA